MKAFVLAVFLVGGCVTTDADTLGGALASLEVAPAAATRDVVTVDVSGALTVSYTSPDPAILEITVDGATVLTQSLDVSTSLTVDLAATVPLHEGPNHIVAVARYRGESLTKSFLVDAAMVAPTITLPMWTRTYTPHEGLVASGTIGVAADPAYTVASTAVSIDGGPWLPAARDGMGGWVASIVNPDLGTSDVAVRVTTAVDGHTAATEVHGTLTVAPVFACNSAASMLPGVDMIQNNGTEQRVMVGYFGDPGGGHDVSFVIGFTDQNNDRYTVVSQTVRYGISQIAVSWNVSRLRCNTDNGNCSSAYDLSVFVDGVPLCSQNGFGRVLRFD